MARRRFRRGKRKRRGKALATKGYVKRLLHSNIENKFLTGASTAVAMSDTLGGVLLNGVGQGDDVFQRAGNRIRMRYLRIRVHATTAVDAAIPAIARIMVLYDRQTNLAASPDTTILQTATAGLGYLSPFNLNYNKRYKVLYDQTRKIQVYAENNAGTASFAEDATWIIRIPLKGMLTAYAGTGTTVASISKGSLAMYHISDIASGTANSLFFSYEFNMEYEDA